MPSNTGGGGGGGGGGVDMHELGKEESRACEPQPRRSSVVTEQEALAGAHFHNTFIHSSCEAVKRIKTSPYNPRLGGENRKERRMREERLVALCESVLRVT